MISRGETASRKDAAPKPAAPSISVPKGGGAIRGMGEKFGADPATGTGSMSVPVATSPGRSGFGPQLTLHYDSSAGNGPVGFGWRLSIASITRKTERGLPRYDDAAQSDVFILSGADDLVPVLLPNGDRFADTVTAPPWTIHRYRPRIEGLFARIERWTNAATGDVYWRTIGRDNVTTFYGRTPESRIADPADPARIFSWLVCESWDDKGNAIRYGYAAENDEGVDLALASEAHRSRGANRYLERIQYGNRVSRLVQPDLSLATWMFEVVLDYGEGHYQPLPPDAGIAPDDQHPLALASAAPVLPWNSAARSWPARPDPFSSYRSAFELRSHRRCHRILMFHRFDELGAEPCLVRATELEYDDFDYARPFTVEQELASAGSTRTASCLSRIIQSGYVRESGRPLVERAGVKYPTYRFRSLPPLEFGYSQAVIQDDVREMEADSLENLPAGLHGANYHWIDLDGEGLSGVLTEQGGAWFYKPNLGQGRLGAMRTVVPRPSFAALGGGVQQLLDLAGDGQLDLVAFGGPAPGFYERTPDDDWEPFKSFVSLPNLAWDDPNLRFVDLDGDGHADVLIAADQVFTWHPSLAEDGFGPARRVDLPADEERGPHLVFADGTQSVYLADMSADGLTDLVRVRNGEVAYWPNLGYGRFGAKITMDGSPVLDPPDQFDQRRVRLADVDGSGTADLIYLGRDTARVYVNQSGNRWSAGRAIRALPPVDDITAVAATDLLGNGTACLVWSSPLPGDARRPLRYIDLMGGSKPHLLVRVANNLGAESLIQYAPSTRFYVADQLAGTPWVTRIPFPVHVVERVDTCDHVSRSRFVTRYAYHHGYFDGVEREFRGFGRVDQWDTEEYAALDGTDLMPAAVNLDAATHVPPVETRTWFHTGVYLGREEVSDYLVGRAAGARGEYYREPAWRDDPDEAGKRLLDDTVLPGGMSVDEEREACRALKGTMLRQEVYARDGTAKAEHPYAVTEQSFAVELAQPRGSNPRAVFFTHPREAITSHYERNPRDPRVTHALTLEVDAYGHPLRTLAVAYPRAAVPERQPEQNQTHLTLTLDRVANRDDQPDERRIGLPVETRSYELVKPPTAGLRVGFDELRLLVEALVPAGQHEPPAAKTIPYERWDWRKAWDPATEPGGTANTRLRLIEHVRTLYRPDDLGAAQGDPLALMPLGVAGTLAVPGQSYKLAFTPGLLAEVYRRPRHTLPAAGAPPAEDLLPDPAAVLGGGGPDRGGYVRTQTLKASGAFPNTDPDDCWWIPSGRTFLSPGAADTATVEEAYARKHFFLPGRQRDPFHGNAVSTESVATYDAYDLLLVSTRDAFDNLTTVETRDDAGNAAVRLDYRVLQPWWVTDPNGNRTAVAFDVLGLVVGSAVMGKHDEAPVPGDRMTGAFLPDLTQSAVDGLMADPRGAAAAGLLGEATTRFVYDVTAWWREPDPAKKPPVFALSLKRETHVSDAPAGALRIQASISYTDGFGREIQKKLQAEPGPVPRRDAAGKVMVDADGQPQMTANPAPSRWVGSGWTVTNNKGKPVRTYEPFFTDRHGFEFDVRIGVSPTLFYDPVERVIATLHPDHSWEKVVLDPWRQDSWDVNDTVDSEPQTDPDIGGFFARPDGTPRLPAGEYLPTWHALRIDAANAAEAARRWPDPRLRAAERTAAGRAAIHAGTSTVAHFDALGRTFLTVAHNRFKYSDDLTPAPPTEEFYRTRTLADAEGNEREIVDAGDRLIMRYDYDMLGNRIHQASMEAGERWMINDAAGKPLHAWDSRGHRFRTTYDRLRRPVDSLMREGGGAERVVGRIVYGETLAAPEVGNRRGKVAQAFDQAGRLTTDLYDFKGNLVHGERTLAQVYDATLDYGGAVPLVAADTYGSSTGYDALDRPTERIAPDASVIRFGYNPAGLLDTVNANLRGVQQNGVPVWTAFVRNIDYDAKGQRTFIEYGSGAAGAQPGVATSYTYDPRTYRLTHLETRRSAADFPLDCPQQPDPVWPGCQVQSLSYTYDPVGNITAIRDDAQQTVFFANKRVEPSAEYTYDATYRLIDAAGREHLGQVGGSPVPHSYDDVPRVRIDWAANDGKAMGRYLERYVYDAAGNIKSMEHRGTDPIQPGWTRTSDFLEDSQLEAGQHSNRLTSTTVGATTQSYSTNGDGYDAHGNMLRMPQLQELQWDFKDQLRMTRRQAVNAEDADGAAHAGERTWYVYDGAGQRVRKVTEAAPGQVAGERVYVGGFEVHRRPGVNGLVLETLHIMDDKERIALVETRTQGDGHGLPPQLIRYQLGNHLGSASLELDDRGRIISYEEYGPYGSTSYQAVRDRTETPKRYRYTGRELDEESGLYHHGARYYARWLGRWTQCDPAGTVDGQNFYSYCRNNPIIRRDPDGRDSVVFDNKDIKADPSSHVILGHAPKPPSKAKDQPAASGVPKATGQARAPGTGASGAATGSDVGDLPANRYVDVFESVVYDIDYKAKGGNLSTMLQVRYKDGTSIDVSINDIHDERSDAPATIALMTNAKVGEGGRIFPERMNASTTPRLAAAKKSAIAVMEQYNFQFMVATLPAVLIIVGAAGAPPLVRPLPRTPTALPSVQAAARMSAARQVGATIGQAVKGQATGKMAGIVQGVTKLGLPQAEATAATNAAVTATGLRTAVVGAGENQIVASVMPGLARPVLVVRPDGTVVQGVADLVIEGLQFVVKNLHF